MFDSDDALYAQMAREMVQSGDYLDNRWLGVVHFEKPPLLLWALAAAGAAFGFGEASLRAAVTLFAITGLVGLYLLGRALALAPRAAIVASALLAVSTFYLMLTRRLMTDIPLVSCALLAAAFALRGAPLRSGLCAGLALLAKSVAALPLLLAGYGFALATRTLPARAALRSTLCALAVAAPWHLVLFARNGMEFVRGYFGHHVGARLSHGVVPGLGQLERIEVLSRERLLLALALVGAAVPLVKRAVLPVHKFAFGWLVLSLLPIAFGASVLPHYFLPLAPAFALLAVAWVPARHFQHRLAPLVAAATVAASLVADPAKLVWWLDPDFSPAVKAIGQELVKAAHARDAIGAYNRGSSGLVFYSGGLPVAIYADDPRFIAVERGVLMTQRQAGHAGALVDVREVGLPANDGAHRFIVASAGGDLRGLVARLREHAPERPLFRLDAGELCLLDDAGVGRPWVPASSAQ